MPVPVGQIYLRTLDHLLSFEFISKGTNTEPATALSRASLAKLGATRSRGKPFDPQVSLRCRCLTGVFGRPAVWLDAAVHRQVL